MLGHIHCSTEPLGGHENFYFIYSQFYDKIYIQVCTCANGLDVDIAYICPLQLVRQFNYIYMYTHTVTQIQKLSNANTNAKNKNKNNTAFGQGRRK